MGKGQGEYINTVSGSTGRPPLLTWKCLGVGPQVDSVGAIIGHHRLYVRLSSVMGMSYSSGSASEVLWEQYVILPHCVWRLQT